LGGMAAGHGFRLANRQGAVGLSGLHRATSPPRVHGRHPEHPPQAGRLALQQQPWLIRRSTRSTRWWPGVRRANIAHGCLIAAAQPADVESVCLPCATEMAAGNRLLSLRTAANVLGRTTPGLSLTCAAHV